MSTQPYTSPDLESSSKEQDPGLEPVADDVARDLSSAPNSTAAAQQEAARVDADDPRTRTEGHAQSTTDEASPSGDDEDLDEALEDTFPASDPISP